VGGDTFTKTAITLELNEIFSPNSGPMYIGSIFGCGNWTLGGTITGRKT